MSVLVTGASGFVGTHLIDALRRTLPPMVRLISVDRQKSDSRPLPEGVARAAVDVTDAGAVDQLVSTARPTHVFHLAARSSVHQAQTAARATFDVNFGGTQILANALRTHAPGCVVIFASTGEVYGSAFA
jgi:GDP-4-dehydro-6-deoxy-D-mannose reductase